jgi:hypothetical protein
MINRSAMYGKVNLTLWRKEIIGETESKILPETECLMQHSMSMI